VRSYEVFFRDYVNPFMRDRGFVRKGRTYRRYADLRDCAVVHFQASQGSYPGHYAFFVNIAVVPRPWHEFAAGGLNHAAVDKEPDAHGSYMRRLAPPPASYSWSVTDVENFASEWQQLEGPLSAAVAQLVALLDRGAFVSYCESGGRHVYPSREVVVAVLLADSADADTLEELLVAIDSAYGGWPEFTSFMRARIAARSTS
jgi:hypothetical protein